MGIEETSAGLNVSGLRQAFGVPSVGFGTVGGEHDVWAICCAEAVFFICDEGEGCVFVSRVKIVPGHVHDGRLQSVISHSGLDMNARTVAWQCPACRVWCVARTRKFSTFISRRTLRRAPTGNEVSAGGDQIAVRPDVQPWSWYCLAHTGGSCTEPRELVQLPR